MVSSAAIASCASTPRRYGVRPPADGVNRSRRRRLALRQVPAQHGLYHSREFRSRESIVNAMDADLTAAARFEVPA